MKRYFRGIIRQFIGGKRYPKVITGVLRDKLTYLDDRALMDLYETIQELEAKAVPGLLVEAGCALGGSAIVIADAKLKTRTMYVYDVFGMIPPPGEQDGEDVHNRFEVIQSGHATGIGGRPYYGYEDNLKEKVETNFSKFNLPLVENNIHLVKGLFQDTIKISEPVAFAHIDADWYESVKTCLERIEPYLSTGGVLVIDDYDAWSSCRKAVDEYFDEKKREYLFLGKSRLHIIRQTAGSIKN